MVTTQKRYFEALDLVVESEFDNINHLIEKVEKAIDNLPSKCRHFLLNKKEGLTHREIVEYINISAKTIEGHIIRAFKILNEKTRRQSKCYTFLAI